MATNIQTDNQPSFLRRLFTKETRVTPELKQAAEEYHIASRQHSAALKELERCVAEKS